MQDHKLAFIKKDMFTLLRHLPADKMGSWGKMNAQQMVEHSAGFFDISAGKGKVELVTPEEHLPKFMEFLLSDKQFRENTKAPVKYKAAAEFHIILQFLPVTSKIHPVNATPTIPGITPKEFPRP